nr:nicotinamide/nicotinic acid mononucleotide adenylyltransferase isoform X1 [Tanacetum cinerariifolium]
MDDLLPTDKLSLDENGSSHLSTMGTMHVVLVSTGSFNPPTFMHLRLFEMARDALNSKGFQVVGGYMSPVNDAYKKKGLIPAVHRITMCQLACKSSEFVMVDTWEAKQSSFQRSLTVLSRIRSFFCDNGLIPSAYLKVMLVCGSDLLESFSTPGAWIPEQNRSGLYAKITVSFVSEEKAKTLRKFSLEVAFRKSTCFVRDLQGNDLLVGKLAPFSNSLERRYFSKTKSVPKINVSEGLSKPITAQTLPQTARQVFAPILGYGDLVQGNITINKVYYVKGLNHNLFSVGQFCDADLEVAFCKSTCFVRDLQGNDLLTGNRGSDLYTISLQELTSSTPLCLMAKASPTQSWLWHRRLSHLNFDYIHLLSKKDVVIGLPKLKYVKDQLCSSCELSKAKRSSFKSKVVPSLKGMLNLLHMDLRGPMQVANINGKKYIFVIVDDYSRFTWTLFLYSKDETPEVLKEFLTMIQRNLQALVITVRTDRGTKYGENLDKMKEKGDLCILVGYSTQSKGYRFYNKRTRMIVESIHIHFDEIKEVSKTYIDNDTLGLVFQRQKASYYENSDPVPHLHNVSPSTDAHVPSQQELDLLFGPLYDEFFNAVQTRRQLATDPKICMFALTVSTAELKHNKEAMADSAWIEAMHEELHNFDRLQVWELVDKPFGKTVIRLNWSWKNKKDEDQTEM